MLSKVIASQFVFFAFVFVTSAEAEDFESKTAIILPISRSMIFITFTALLTDMSKIRISFCKIMH